MGSTHPETFTSIAGVGDLDVTCRSIHGRNRRFGREIVEKGILAPFRDSTTSSPHLRVGLSARGSRRLQTRRGHRGRAQAGPADHGRRTTASWTGAPSPCSSSRSTWRTWGRALVVVRARARPLPKVSPSRSLVQRIALLLVATVRLREAPPRPLDRAPPPALRLPVRAFLPGAEEGRLLGQLAPTGVAAGVELAGLERRAHRASGLALMAAIAELAQRGQLLDFGEGPNVPASSSAQS